MTLSSRLKLLIPFLILFAAGFALARTVLLKQRELPSTLIGETLPDLN